MEKHHCEAPSVDVINDNNSKPTSSKRRDVMRQSKQMSIFASLLFALFLVMNSMDAQNIVNNGRITNKAGKTLTAGSVDNNLNILNSGTISVSGNFDNNNANADVRNYGTAAGTISVTGNFDNTSGLADNDSSDAGFVGSLAVGGVLTPGTRFDTDSGRVVFSGGSGQSVPALTYGALAAEGAGAKTLAGNVTVNDTMRIEVYFSVSSFNLNVKAGTGIISDSDTATFNGGTGTVDYSANANQSIYPSVLYSSLSLSNTTANRNKTATGDVTVLGALTISTKDSLDVTGTFTLNGGSTTLDNTGGIKLGGSATVNPNTLTNTGTFVYYSNVASQSVAAFAYADLILRNAGVKTFAAGTYSTSGDFRFEGTMDATKTDFQASSIFQYIGTGAQGVAADTYVTLEFAQAGQKNILGSVTASAVNVASTVTGSGNDGVYVGTSGSLTVNGTLTNDGAITNDGTITVN